MDHRGRAISRITRSALLAGTMLTTASLADNATDTRVTPSRGTALTSSSRRFIVAAPDRRAGLTVSNWAETMSDKLQAVTRQELLGHTPRGIRIVLRDVPDADNTLTVEEIMEAGTLVHRLTAVNLAQADYEDFQGLLCQILLRRHLVALAARNGRRLTSGSFPAGGGMPDWLWEGLSQHTLPGLHIRNLRLAGGEWHRGRLPPVAAILNASAPLDMFDPERGWDTLRRRAVHGTFMLWFLSFPEPAARLGRLFASLANGEPVAAATAAALIPDCDSVGHMDTLWDEWMLAQNHVIRMPGAITPENIQHLRGELLLYPGEYGIPMTGQLYERLEWEDLINRRDEDWIPTFARIKASDLRLGATGRDAGYAAVAEAYAHVLDGLRKGRSETVLRKALATATMLKADLKRHTAGPPLAPPRAPDDATEQAAQPYDPGHGLGFAWE